jgi:hypothetical protein
LLLSLRSFPCYCPNSSAIAQQQWTSGKQGQLHWTTSDKRMQRWEQQQWTTINLPLLLVNNLTIILVWAETKNSRSEGFVQ